MRRNNAGFTLVEVIMAVTIAVMVSVAAASVILATRKTAETTRDTSVAVTYAGNMLECFKASDSLRDFKKSVEFAYGAESALTSSDWSSGDPITFYVYFNNVGKVSTSDTAWPSGEGIAQNTAFFAAVKISGYTGNTAGSFKTGTTAQIVVYDATSFVNSMTLTPSAPDMEASESDARVIYRLDDYVKGVVG